MRELLLILQLPSLTKACSKSVDFGKSSSKFECEETGTFNHHTRCVFHHCNYDGECSEVTCLIRYDGSIDGEDRCNTLTMTLPVRLRNRILDRLHAYDYEQVEGSSIDDCDYMSDDEELSDCFGRRNSERSWIVDPIEEEEQTFLNYENIILLVGTFLGIVGAVLLAFLIAKSKNVMCFKQKRTPKNPDEHGKFLGPDS